MMLYSHGLCNDCGFERRQSDGCKVCEHRVRVAKEEVEFYAHVPIPDDDEIDEEPELQNVMPEKHHISESLANMLGIARPTRWRR